MKLHVYILLLAGFFPYQASALVSEALETASGITSDVAHEVAEPVGEATDVALDGTVGTVESVLPPARYNPSAYRSRKNFLLKKKKVMSMSN